jgi:hypothetical protein
MNKFCNTIIEEQETTINIDYFKKAIIIYTSRKSVYDRLSKKLGEPTRIFFYKNKMSGVIWEIPFEDRKRANVIFSKTIVIGQC